MICLKYIKTSSYRITSYIHNEVNAKEDQILLLQRQKLLANRVGDININNEII